MSIRAVCECGKKFEAKDEYEGRRAICPSCKREFVFQRAGIPIFQEVLELPPPLPVRVDDDDDQCLPESPPAPEPSRPFWKDPIVVIGATVPILILCIFFGYLALDYRTKALHRRVYSLKLTVDRSLASGNVRQAFDYCQQILKEAGSPESQDAKIKGYAEFAKSIQDELYPKVKSVLDQEESDRQTQAKADEILARTRADNEKLSKFHAEIRGGAWLTNKLGQSNVLRGLRVYLLRSSAPKVEISDLLARANDRAVLRRSAEETFVQGSQGAVDPKIVESLRKSRLTEMQTLRAVALPDRWLYPTDTFHNLIRDSSLGLPLNRITEDDLWPPAVERLTVQQTTTDIEGKYKFADVRGGVYYVHALFATDHAVAEWLSTVVVQNNEAASIDLYNDTAVSIVNQSDR
jgi:hypothetical protein